MQVYYKGRRDSRSHSSPDRSGGSSGSPKFPRLPRQSTAIDESTLPVGPWGRRGSQPSLSPEAALTMGSSGEDAAGPGASAGSRKARRDSLSPDSAAKDNFAGGRRGRRDSRTHLSPDRAGGSGEGGPRDVSPRRRLRRQSTVTAGGMSTGDEHPPPRGRRSSRAPRSPESSSTCSSRDPSPKAPAIRRQSTTEEILIARGFRRQSTTEEMIRCRNFRRQSSQSDDVTRSRGRRDSCAQITDGTLATMTVETTSTFFDTSTQTGK
ncbi:hypothetical protein J437_LFUL004810 [Ladona fulva]|uniref:Uncharacterized protein n=1 Tax=Ladona fulva TaxID=123851 RepID=A0A8K0K1H2_LADFU|nr:hypothetical protein J437_LFUL004810 [Ladona fulva]